MKVLLNPRTAVVGATGAVGRVMLGLLSERQFPASEILALASARSVGRELPFGDGFLKVGELSKESLKGVDLAILDTPDEVAREWGPVAVEAGALVVDNSAAWRMEPDVPLVVPEINPQDAFQNQGIIASPNCTTIGVVVPAFVLHREWQLERMTVASYQATSGAGQPGVEELREQAAKLYDSLDELGEGQGNTMSPTPNVFAAPIAFNIVPQIGSEKELGYTSEEWKLLYESRKIMGIEGLKASATCVRVPSVVGHGAAVHATFATEVHVERAKELFAAAPGIRLHDVPNPFEAAGIDDVLVGRLRPDPFDPNSLWFFSASDNLRKGAALNAVQIAELLFEGTSQP